MMNIKKIYGRREALVSDEFINSSDSDINKGLPESEPGMVIYTAGHTVEKQKSLDGSWVVMATRGSSIVDVNSLATKDDLETLATKEEIKKLATKDELKTLATKSEIAGFASKEEVAGKVSGTLSGDKGTAEIFNETDGGGARFTGSDGLTSYAGVNDGVSAPARALMYVKDADGNGPRLFLDGDKAYYSHDAYTAEADYELATKGDLTSVTDTAGTPGKDGVTPQLQKSDTAIQVSYDGGSQWEDLVALSVLKGENGASGKDGKSVTAIELKVDADGKVTGGTVTFDDESTAAITVTLAES